MPLMALDAPWAVKILSGSYTIFSAYITILVGENEEKSNSLALLWREVFIKRAFVLLQKYLFLTFLQDR